MGAPWELKIGSIDFSPDAQTGDVTYYVTGLRRGKPVPVVSVMDSVVQGITSERVDGHGNRDQSFIIGMKGPDSATLAAAEKDLFRELQKVGNELTWTAPDRFSPATVFEVLWADLEFSDSGDWDLDELRGCRVWVLTLRTLPFGRSVQETVEEALPVGATPVTTVVSDGASATGWTSPGGAVTSTSGYLVVPGGPSVHASYEGGIALRQHYPEASLAMATVDFTATPYLSLEVSPHHAWEQIPFSPRVWVDGVELTCIASSMVNNLSALRCTYICNDASASTLRVSTLVETTAVDGDPAPGASIRLDNVTRSNQPPSMSSTGRESVRTIEIGGSARTQASLSVSHDTAGLGDVLVYTTPALSASYTPDLRRWRQADATNVVTADATTVSGSRNDLAVSDTFLVPANSLPRGGYVLMARVRAQTGTTTKSMTWTAATKIGAATFGAQSGTAAAVSLGTGWKIVTLGGMTLPPTDVAAGSSASVQVTIDAGSGGTAIDLDEAWLFHLGDDASLTWVACGTGAPALGTAHNQLWLDSATLARPSAVWKGTRADKSDAFHAGDDMPSFNAHSFPPGALTMFLVTTGAANPRVPVRYFKRWHTHAGE